MVSGQLKSTGIPRVDGLSTGPSDLGCHRKSIVDFVVCLTLHMRGMGPYAYERGC